MRPSNKINLDSKGKVINVNSDYDADAAQNIPDAYQSEISMQNARMNADVTEQHLMTNSQMLTYHNHHGQAKKYDKISVFSLRPPELLGVFRNPSHYFRYCFIDDRKIYGAEK